MSKNERVVSDPEAAGWEFDSDTGYWMWKGEEGTGGGSIQDGDTEGQITTWDGTEWTPEGAVVVGNDGDTTFSGSVNLAGGGLKYRTASNITLDSDAIAGYLAIGGTEHYSWNATDFRSQTDGQYDLGASNAKWKDGFFSGAVYVKGSPLTRTVDLITTLVTLRQATMDETQDIREALRSAIDELVGGFEQEIATMPVPEPEVSTMPAPEDS